MIDAGLVLETWKNERGDLFSGGIASRVYRSALPCTVEPEMTGLVSFARGM